MGYKRRKYDNIDACDLAVRANERVDDMDEELTKVSDKLDMIANKVVKTQWMTAGFIACMMFLVKYPKILLLLQSTAANAAERF